MITREEGFFALYKGLLMSLSREASYSTLRLGLYEPYKVITILLIIRNYLEQMIQKILHFGRNFQQDFFQVLQGPLLQILSICKKSNLMIDNRLKVRL